MSKDNERYDSHHYHHDNFTQKKVRENEELRKNRIDKSPGNSTQGSHENDTSSTVLLHRDKSERNARLRMEVKKVDVHAEISKCRDLSAELQADLSERLSDIDMTLADAATRLKKLAEEVEEIAQEKYDLYLRAGKRGTAGVLRENLRSIQDSLLMLVDKALEYQIDFGHQD